MRLVQKCLEGDFRSIQQLFRLDDRLADELRAQAEAAQAVNAESKELSVDDRAILDEYETQTRQRFADEPDDFLKEAQQLFATDAKRLLGEDFEAPDDRGEQ